MPRFLLFFCFVFSSLITANTAIAHEPLPAVDTFTFIDGKDYYSYLELTESATGEEIRAAYLHLIRANHPDAGGTGDLERAQNINRVYQVLKDEVKRRAYDRWLDRELQLAAERAESKLREEVSESAMLGAEQEVKFYLAGKPEATYAELAVIAREQILSQGERFPSGSWSNRDLRKLVLNYSFSHAMSAVWSEHTRIAVAGAVVSLFYIRAKSETAEAEDALEFLDTLQALAYEALLRAPGADRMHYLSELWRFLTGEPYVAPADSQTTDSAGCEKLLKTTSFVDANGKAWDVPILGTGTKNK